MIDFMQIYELKQLVFEIVFNIIFRKFIKLVKWKK